MDEGFAGCSGQAFANLRYAKQVKIGASAGVRHLSRHIEPIVKNNADVANGRQQRYSRPANVNGSLIRRYAWSCRSKHDCFRFRFVQKQVVTVQPPFQFVHTIAQLSERVGMVRRRTLCIQLSIVCVDMVADLMTSAYVCDR